MSYTQPLLDNNNRGSNPGSRNVSVDKDRLRHVSISEEEGRKVSSSLLENPFLAKLGTEKDLQEGFHVGFQEATWTSSYINLLNTIVGSGMLGLPWAFAQTGWILGSLLLLCSAVSSSFSLHILSICATKTPQPSSFYSVTEATLPKLTFLVDLAVFFQCFGVCISYLIVISGLMPQVLSGFGVHNGFITERVTWVIIGFCIVAPLACLKNLDALKYTSGFAMLFVVCLTVLITCYATGALGLDPCEDFDILDDGVCEGEKSNVNFSLETFHSLSIFIFAFSCQPNIFAVVNELRKPSQQRFDSVINCSIATALFVYATVSICGYSTYGDEVLSNILMNYPHTPLTSVTRIFVCLLVAFSYPLLAFPGRQSALNLWRKYDNDKEPSFDVAGFRWIMVTFCFLISTLIIALLVTDLGIILGLVGATGATVVSYILPGLAYYTLHKDEPADWKLYCSYSLFLAGCVIMPVCLLFIFI